MKIIADTNIVNQINIVWEESPNFSGTKVLNCPSELRVIKDFFSKSYWQDTILIARSIKNHYGIDINGSGFRFTTDLEPDEKVFEGVELYDPYDEVYIDEKSFKNLTLKFFKALLQGANSHKRELLVNSSWWTEFTSIVTQLET